MLWQGFCIQMVISVTVIEVTDGEDANIVRLSQAICNGKMSWIQTHHIPLTIQEDAKVNGDTRNQTDRHFCHFQTAGVSTTGLHNCHKHIAYNKTTIK